MKMILRIALAACVSLAPFCLAAHGIVRTIEEGRAMVVTALYDDGEPISYAAVRIFAPGDRKVEFQNGRTDARGRFSFVPHGPGDWLVRLDDGGGHGFEEHVAVDADMRGKASSPALVKFGQKVIVLLLLSWGGVMTALYVRKAKAG
ncbi:MAG: hypothetical protein JXA07_16520 [Spirochaetes bacterium]|nr:hypothetical protein [Spirochaetota bacterium]